jgi:hypothetical protein
VERPRGALYGDDVADVIPIDHIRRSRRLFRILVDRLGLEHFLDEGERRFPRLDAQAVDAALALCADWIERRTGGYVDGISREVMERQLRRLLILRVAERLVNAHTR